MDYFIARVLSLADLGELNTWREDSSVYSFKIRKESPYGKIKGKDRIFLQRMRLRNP